MSCGRLAIAALALSVTACVKVDANLTIQANDQIDGSIVMAVDRQFAAEANQSPDALVEQVRKSTFHSTPSGARLEAYSDEKYVGKKLIVDQMALIDFDGGTGDDGLKIVHQDGRFKLSGTVDTAGLGAAASASNSAAARRMADGFAMSIRVTFPGRVIHSNGHPDGRTVTWNPKLGQRLDLVAEAEDGRGGVTWSWLLLGLLAVGAVLALGLAVGLHSPALTALRR